MEAIEPNSIIRYTSKEASYREKGAFSTLRNCRTYPEMRGFIIYMNFDFPYGTDMKQV